MKHAPREMPDVTLLIEHTLMSPFVQTCPGFTLLFMRVLLFVWPLSAV